MPREPTAREKLLEEKRIADAAVAQWSVLSDPVRVQAQVDSLNAKIRELEEQRDQLLATHADAPSRLEKAHAKRDQVTQRLVAHDHRHDLKALERLLKEALKVQGGDQS